jgi:branched-chain amino acid transport system substrate-binding protein
MRITRVLSTGLVVAVASVTVAACGSSGSKSSASPGSGSSSSKAPIRVMVEGIETPDQAFGGVAFPWAATGVKAAAAAIDASGGINGRQLKVDVCDNKGDPNQSAACGREAQSNGDIALVGAFDPNAVRIVPILEAEKIPYIGGIPSTPTEFSSPVSFQFDPGPVLAASAVTSLWKSSGCTRLVSILPANGANTVVAAEQKAIAAKLGIPVQSVLYPQTITDVTPTISSALASHPNCVNYDGTGQIGVRFIAGLRQQGFTGKIITSVGSLSPMYIRALGSKANGILALSAALTTTSGSSGVGQFNQQMATYLKHNPAQIAMNSNEFAQSGWSSVQVVKQALSGSSTPTAAYLLKKIPTMCNVNVGNFYPHVNFCKSETTSKLLPRVYNDEWQYLVAKNGTYAATNNQWHNLAAAIPAG